jgi:hypothetical protein
VRDGPLLSQQPLDLTLSGTFGSCRFLQLVAERIGRIIVLGEPCQPRQPPDLLLRRGQPLLCLLDGALVWQLD